MHFLTNLHPEMKVAAHLRLFCRIELPREAQAKAESHSRGLKAAKVPRRRSSLHQRLEDGEGVESEVYQIDDMAGWTHIASLFVGHKNICKSQKTVITP
jgi:hypothetical protein